MDLITLTNENSNLLVNKKNINPVGSIICYAGLSAPSGWLFCDGSEVSKTTYNSLFLVIGNLYGTPLNSNNFILPDLRARFPLGKSNINSLADVSGNQNINLDINQLPAHTHTGTTDASGIHSHSATDSGHSHSYDDAYFAENIGGLNIYGTSAGTDTDNDYIYRTPTPSTSTGYANVTIGSNGNHSHTFTTNSIGSGSSINIMNPYIVLNYLIKY